MEATVADNALSQHLSALASPTRIALMRSLRSPKVLRDIEVRPEQDAALIARQTVRKHLDILLDEGLVSARTIEMVYGETQEFVVNHQRIFSLAEELRNLARMTPTIEPSIVTVQGGDLSPLPRDRSVLVLVKGLDEGRTFDLDPKQASEWIVGRRRGIAVSVDFDPSTSGENAVIRWVEGAHWIEDVPTSRNGTSVNFGRLAPGQKVKLAHGDIIGVGRCLFVYRR